MSAPFQFRSSLTHPALGLEAEFTPYVDGLKVVPEEYWRHPSAFIEGPLLRRSTKSSLLPTGGAIYFDGGVIELVTAALELERYAPARAVRSLWRQIAFVRDELTKWESRNGNSVRLEGFSAHYNVSFELAREERGRNRTIQKLALLLAYLLPVPLIVLGANRRSTGVGVRPRRDRLEVTLDFTPDAGLMTAVAALVAGIVRGAMRWPGFLLQEIERRSIELPAGVSPVRHTTRKGWLVRAEQFPEDPFKSDLNARIWMTTSGKRRSLREIALCVAWRFRHDIGAHSDPFTFRLLFAVLTGRLPSLLDLDDRPAAYEDVGGESRWGLVLPELRDPERRRSDVRTLVDPPWSGEEVDRRGLRRPLHGDRRHAVSRMTASVYEAVFVRLASGSRLAVGTDTLAPVAMKGWYNAVMRSESTGEERVLSIDQIIERGTWIDES
jgi:hypothetical protein